MKDIKNLEGILVIDKPEGLTSTQALEEVKRILKIKFLQAFLCFS